MTALCVAEHADPTETSPGLQVCAWHRSRADTDLRDLPRVRAALLLPTQRRSLGPSGEAPQPMSDARRQARSAIRAVLVSWVLVLIEADRARGPAYDLGDIQDAWCADTVRRHLDWLLAGEHADQLCHDLEQTGTWRAVAEPDPPSITIACRCGDRVRIDTEQIMRCRTCGEWGLLSWWTEQVQARTGPQTLRDLADVLLAQHGLDVPLATLRTWARRGRIQPVPWVAVDKDEALRYDPVQVADHAYGMTQRRRVPA